MAGMTQPDASFASQPPVTLDAPKGPGADAPPAAEVTPGSALAALAREHARKLTAGLGGGPAFTFAIPVEDRQLPTDPQTFTIGLMLLGTQMDAEKAALAKGTDANWEAIERVLLAVDGKPIGWENAARETFLEALSPRARGRLNQAFMRVHNPEPKRTDDFFASQVVR